LGPANFAEIAGFLATSGLVQMTDGDAGARLIEVPGEKRKTLDFYKNNSIHFFLLPSLVAHAGLRRIGRADLKEERWWWLDLLRWEFALPERESVAAEVGRTLEYFRAHGAVLGEEVSESPLVAALAGIIENFREAYWIAVRTAMQLDGDAMPE